MGGLTAVLRVEHPDLALTETVAADPSATIHPVREAGTDAESDDHHFVVQSADFERFEEALDADPTVETFARVTRLGDEVLYRVAYTSRAILFSPELTRADGLALDIENDGTGWTMTVWLPDRERLARIWAFAEDHGVDVRLRRIADGVDAVDGAADAAADLTAAQREALLTALDAGYFEEPREVTLGEVAAALDISQPAAGGLLRRGIKRLLLATVAR
ncbi:helix-turn-helix domain-containing protein [Haloplanus halophilus]|uniref:helix-turn-helix domain-containing protein n=1 Tax=Haloplanus halophilus TaxID=2949993 RepID=UPI00203D888F|nr:helix-turn-helix domain-containing protein [Haloplanus sp. GDY1]